MSNQKRKEKTLNDSLKHLFAGGIAGAVSRTCVSPLERLKILFQVQNPQAIKYKGIIPSLRMIWVEEGLLGYFKGNGTNVVRIFPYSAVQFAAFEQCKGWLIAPGASDLTVSTRLLAGAIAGVTSVAITYPLDLVRTRLSVTDGRYNSMTGAVRHVVRTEGATALYKGITPTVLGVAPYVGLNFMCYETIKAAIRARGEPSTVQLLAAGGLAGAVAQTVTYPLDVLRRKMQMQGSSAEFPPYSSTWSAARDIWKTQSWRGFYRGLIPNYLKVVPAISITFVVYERVKGLIGAS